MDSILLKMIYILNVHELHNAMALYRYDIISHEPLPRDWQLYNPSWL